MKIVSKSVLFDMLMNGMSSIVKKPQKHVKDIVNIMKYYCKWNELEIKSFIAAVRLEYVNKYFVDNDKSIFSPIDYWRMKVFEKDNMDSFLYDKCFRNCKTIINFNKDRFDNYIKQFPNEIRNEFFNYLKSKGKELGGSSNDHDE